MLGKVRAKQYYNNDKERHHTLGILLHGDGSFAGQGVVYETLDMSALPDYTTGGTIHIVVNNQVGCLVDHGLKCITCWTGVLSHTSLGYSVVHKLVGLIRHQTGRSWARGAIAKAGTDICLSTLGRQSGPRLPRLQNHWEIRFQKHWVEQQLHSRIISAPRPTS